MGFFPEHIRMLLGERHTVELACNTDDSKVPASLDEFHLMVYNIPFSRSPLSKQNLEGYKEIRQLIRRGNYDIVHTHTPNASACVRLACKGMKDVKVIYTAHGFHFYKGAPLKNWLLFYPVEWLCAHWTDTLITINQEDYALAKKHMHAKRVCYVPGVGLDLAKFGEQPTDRENIRKNIGVPEGMTWLLTVGELSKRKNHEPLIRAVAEIPDAYLTIAGQGSLLSHLQELINSLDIADRVKLLGFRTDISDLCESADIYVHPALQEGLPVAVMEAMACGLPCVVSRIRGNTDLIDDEGGALFDPKDVSDIKARIEFVMKNHDKMGAYNRQRIKEFGFKSVLDDLKPIYTGV